MSKASTNTHGHEMLREFARGKKEQKKAQMLMRTPIFYCQMTGCSNTKATNKGKYCVVCKVSKIQHHENTYQWKKRQHNSTLPIAKT